MCSVSRIPYRLVLSIRRAAVGFIVTVLASSSINASAAFGSHYTIASTSESVFSGDLVASVPFRLNRNRVELQVRVNGSRPLWFMLDSGASISVVNLDDAHDLGLELEGNGIARGEGDGSQEVRFVSDVRLGLKGLDISVPRLAAIKLRSIGTKCSGLLGGDFFARYVIEIAYESKVVNLYEPDTFQYHGRGVLPINIERGLPYLQVAVQVSGHPAATRRLLIDTGSTDAVNDSMIDYAHPSVRVLGTGAVGGNFYTKLGRIDRVGLGNFVFRDVLGISGGVPLVGGDILHRFNVTFDFSRSRVILRPNRHFRDPFSLDSGFGGKIPEYHGKLPNAEIR